MEFMIGEDDGLCRYEKNVAYASFMVGDVWGFNGYAFGVIPTNNCCNNNCFNSCC